MKDHKLARKLRIATLGAASALLLAPLANAQSEDTDEAQVSVEPSEPQVSVKQAEPEVTVDDSGDPNVNVTNDQDDAEVVVERPEPEVKVNMPEPEVKVIQADSAQGSDAAQPDTDAQEDQPQQAQPSAQEQQAQSDTQAEPQESPAQETAVQETTQPAEPPEQSPLDKMRVADLEGQTIYGTGGEELGAIDNVVMANDGSNAGVVISMGGFWGLFEDQVLIPFSQLQLNDDQLVWQTDKSTEEMEETGYDEQNYTEVSPEEYEHVGDLRDA
ncbi:sporulation protein YlmC with PRC-barrel domain [Modicisalibacter xianhensis]|uniref:Sporulation protein YlmC with PRC-barrel domain n=1 Tax=Modicisalibacter xianhensis TaxID=442341 RepID=A0A4R8FUC8_9GAMM|nr:PRC-barrel domain-containing protein [Halomonas xianhensis]TDX27575.1 sporulation protein YlmC with PRC-barrel domain [Halomonas xianhensis]